MSTVTFTSTDTLRKVTGRPSRCTLFSHGCRSWIVDATFRTILPTYLGHYEGDVDTDGGESTRPKNRRLDKERTTGTGRFLSGTRSLRQIVYHYASCRTIEHSTTSNENQTCDVPSGKWHYHSSFVAGVSPHKVTTWKTRSPPVFWRATRTPPWYGPFLFRDGRPGKTVVTLSSLPGKGWCVGDL